MDQSDGEIGDERVADVSECRGALSDEAPLSSTYDEKMPYVNRSGEYNFKECSKAAYFGSLVDSLHEAEKSGSNHTQIYMVDAKQHSLERLGSTKGH